MGNGRKSNLQRKSNHDIISHNTAQIKSWAEVLKMRTDMGQDSISRDEETEWYVNNGTKAFGVNQYLREQAGITNKQHAQYLKENELKDVRDTVDSWMRPTTDDVVVTRFVGPHWIESTFGVKVPSVGWEYDVHAVSSQILNIIKTDRPSYTDPAFLSTSTDVNKNVFSGRIAKISIDVPKGTNAYVTLNKMESEIILARGTTLQFTRATYNKSNNQITFYAKVVNTSERNPHTDVTPGIVVKKTNSKKSTTKKPVKN